MQIKRLKFYIIESCSLLAVLIKKNTKLHTDRVLLKGRRFPFNSIWPLIEREEVSGRYNDSLIVMTDIVVLFRAKYLYTNRGGINMCIVEVF